MSNIDTATLLEKYFDIAFAAPDGIKKLRELILSLAMQGKLVPQDEADQPASELLPLIKAQKDKLVEEGKFKSLQSEQIEDENLTLFQIPKNWVWCRLDDVAAIARGGSPRPIKSYLTDDPEGLNWIKIGDSNRGQIYITETKEKIRPDGLNSTRMVFPDDLILSNSMSFGYPYIMKIEGCIHDGWLLLRTPKDLVDKLFLYYLFLSSHAKNSFKKAASGAVVQNLNADKVRQLLIPLPPLAEQRRIVAKIDELMARCDELEKLKTERDRKQITVHKAALNRLLTAKDHSDFQTSWHFITQHFSELYSVKENVAELRKAILQLAVMGKLVPQDPSDQPASELLKEIEKEKQKLVKEGKIKASKPLPAIKSNEIPYDLPSSWEWVRLGEIVSLLGDGIHGTPIYDDTGDYFFINGNNLTDGKIEIKENTKRVSIEEYKKYKKELNLQTVLVSINGTIGNVAFYNNEKIVLGKSACYFNLFTLIDKYFTKKVINSDYFLQYAFSSATGSTIKNVSLKSMREFVFPLPPLAEQHRIVAKIDQLMTLCDELEKQIDAAESKQTNLLNSMMAKV